MQSALSCLSFPSLHRRALITRNVSRSVEFFHATHFTLPPFVPALSREFTPYKPHPASLLHIARHWEVPSSELVMIGDSAKDDVRREGGWAGVCAGGRWQTELLTGAAPAASTPHASFVWLPNPDP